MRQDMHVRNVHVCYRRQCSTSEMELYIPRPWISDQSPTGNPCLSKSRIALLSASSSTDPGILVSIQMAFFVLVAISVETVLYQFHSHFRKLGESVTTFMCWNCVVCQSSAILVIPLRS